MSVKAMTWVFYHARCTGNARVVLLAIADHADDDGRGARPSIATLALKAGISDRTVQRVLEKLRDHYGELRWQEQAGPRGEHLYEIVMADTQTTTGGGDTLSPLLAPAPDDAPGLSPDVVPLAGVSACDPGSAAALVEAPEDHVPAAGGDNLSPGGVSSCHPSTSAPAAADDASEGEGGDNSVTGGVTTVSPGGVTLLSPQVRPSTSCTSGTTAAAPPPSAPLRQTQTAPAATAPAEDGNYRVIERLAIDLLTRETFASESDFVAAVRDACATHRIDYGRLVPADVVHRACASARIKRLKGRVA